MDIKIDTEAVCHQLQEQIPDQYAVFYCRIEPVEGKEAHTFEVLIPQTDAEFGLIVNANGTVEILRCNPDDSSKALMKIMINKLLNRGFIQVH